VRDQEPPIPFLRATLFVVLVPSLLYAWGALTISTGCVTHGLHFPGLAAAATLLGSCAAFLAISHRRRGQRPAIVVAEVIYLLLGAGLLTFLVFAALIVGSGCTE
jgi:hypothetical protein